MSDSGPRDLMESSGFHGEIQALGISPRPGCWELFSEMWEVVTISRYERRMRLGLESDVQGFQENGFYKVEKKKSSTSQPGLREEGQRGVNLVICGWWQLAWARRKEQKEEAV